MSEGPSQVMMKTLDPIFESGLTVTDIREENRHVLTHPNGKTVGQIITQKIAEPAKVSVTSNDLPSKIEGSGNRQIPSTHVTFENISLPKSEVRGPCGS